MITKRGRWPVLVRASGWRCQDGVGRGQLLHVSAGGPGLGGVQAASVLFRRALGAYAEARGLSYRPLGLGLPSRWQKARLAITTVAAQRGQSGIALFFDHVGPARVQSFVPRALRAPYAVFLHGIEVWGPLRRSAVATLRQAALLLGNSCYTERRAREHTPELPAVRVVGLALPDEHARGAPDEAILARVQKDFFLMVGRMHPDERYKGHDRVLSALAALRRGGAPARGVIVGEGADRPRLERHARELGVAALVHFTGPVSDATREAIYTRCRALVLPSTGEGFGLVYLEAMRAGRPCVAARGGAAEEIVKQGSTGFLVEPSSPLELQEVLARLAQDPALAEALGAAGRARFEEHYTEPRFLARLAPEMDRLVGPALR